MFFAAQQKSTTTSNQSRRLFYPSNKLKVKQKIGFQMENIINFVIIKKKQFWKLKIVFLLLLFLLLLGHRAEDGVVAANRGPVLVVLRFGVAHLIKLRLESKRISGLESSRKKIVLKKAKFVRIGVSIKLTSFFVIFAGQLKSSAGRMFSCLIYTMIKVCTKAQAYIRRPRSIRTLVNLPHNIVLVLFSFTNFIRL